MNPCQVVTLTALNELNTSISPLYIEDSHFARLAPSGSVGEAVRFIASPSLLLFASR